MRVTLLAFGILRDHLPPGFDGSPLDLPEGATVRDLRKVCEVLVPPNTFSWASIAIAVNQEYARESRPLADGDEVALLPPVSGGSNPSPESSAASAAAPLSSHVVLTYERIDTAGLAARIRRGDDGAIVIFDGIVRNQTRGRRTLYLFYEAYPQMALAQMKLLAAQALADYPVRDVAIVHRLGRLEIGESSVFIAVASAHRAAAFDACRWLIDTLKRTVPVWKKEFFEDGAVWAHGEPFPADLAPAPEREK